MGNVAKLSHDNLKAIYEIFIFTELNTKCERNSVDIDIDDTRELTSFHNNNNADDIIIVKSSNYVNYSIFIGKTQKCIHYAHSLPLPHPHPCMHAHTHTHHVFL